MSLTRKQSVIKPILDAIVSGSDIPDDYDFELLKKSEYKMTSDDCSFVLKLIDKESHKIDAEFAYSAKYFNKLHETQRRHYWEEAGDGELHHKAALRTNQDQEKKDEKYRGQLTRLDSLKQNFATLKGFFERREYANCSSCCATLFSRLAGVTCDEIEDLYEKQYKQCFTS